MSSSATSRLRFGRHNVPLPGKRHHRLILGIALCIGGLFWFLPILGLWMLPLGILILSVDSHWVRRRRRRFEVWWHRRRRRPKEK